MIDRMATLTWPQVLGWRMKRQYLEHDAAQSAIAVARRLSGVQAQVASAAECGDRAGCRLL